MNDSSSKESQELDYSIDEWLRDFGALMQASTQGEQLGHAAIRRHFAEHYLDPIQKQHRWIRLMKAFSYLKKNIEKFDFGKAAVVADKEALIGHSIALAFYQLFSHLPDSRINEEPPIELTIELVKEWENSK